MKSTTNVFFAAILLGVTTIIGGAQPANTFTAISDMTSARAQHTATLLANGKVLLAGGVAPTGFDPSLASAELYDPSTGSFTATGKMTASRRQHTATLLADGRVLIAGGRNGAQELGTAELYDPSTGAFAATATMVSIRGLHAASLLADGRVLVTGCALPCNSALAELYDPDTGTFTPADAPSTAGTSTLLTDGRILTTGGSCANDGSGAAQLYDPILGLFIFTGRIPKSCYDINTATLLTDGKVLFVGSAENDGFPSNAELYDAQAGTFSSLARTIGPHEFGAATLLPDGTVLITGGQLPGGNGDPGAELYTPGTGAFTLTGRMNAQRHEQTSTLLPDGTVLIAGGYSAWPGATSKAEVYRSSTLVLTPVLLPAPGDRGGQGAIVHAGTSRLASPTDPAGAGEYLEIYLTGLIDGSVIPPQVSIGGRTAEILFLGKAPGFVDLDQINVRVPGGVTSGSAVRVRLNYLGRTSNEVTIGVH